MACSWRRVVIRLLGTVVGKIKLLVPVFVNASLAAERICGAPPIASVNILNRVNSGLLLSLAHPPKAPPPNSSLHDARLHYTASCHWPVALNPKPRPPGLPRCKQPPPLHMQRQLLDGSITMPMPVEHEVSIPMANVPPPGLTKPTFIV